MKGTAKMKHQPIDQKLMVNNILSVYYDAVQYPTVMEEGMNWYSEANKWCMGVAKGLGVKVDRVAGVVAALSPGNKWERNKLDAVSCMRAAMIDGGVDSFKAYTYSHLNKEKAYRIARGEEPVNVLRGNKVTAFYLLLSSADSKDVVCVDGHAYHVAMGQREAIVTTPTMSDKVYVEIASAYRETAIEINSRALSSGYRIDAAQVQAVCWVLHRIRKGVARLEV